MARITWQNVDAPNLLAGAAARSAAAANFGAGMDSIGELFQSVAGRRRAEAMRTADQAAVAQLLGIQSVSDFDRVAANGGIFNALGVPQEDVSENVMRLALSWRDRLEGDRSTDQAHVQDVFNYGRDVFDQSRDAYAFGRTRAADARSDLMQSVNDQALILADQAARDSLSPDEAARMIRDRASDPRVQVAAQEILPKLGGAYWTNSGAGIADPATNQALGTIEARLDKEERDLAFEFGATPLAALWQDSQSRYQGYDSPLTGMIERLGAEVGDENQEAFGKKKGGVAGAFNRLTEAYPEIPPGMIAAVMENTLRGDGWIRDGNNVTFDDRDIRLQLDKLSTPEGRNDLAMVSTNYARRQETIAGLRNELVQLTSEIGILQDRPASATRDAEIAKRQGRIQELFRGLDQNPTRNAERRPTQTERASMGSVQGPVQGPAQGPARAMAAAATETPGPAEPLEVAFARKNANFRSAVGDAAGTYDRAAAWALTAPATWIGEIGRLGSQAVGTVVSPDLGATGVRSMDRWLQDIEGVREQGVVGFLGNMFGGGPAATPAVPVEPVEPVVPVPVADTPLAQAAPEASRQAVTALARAGGIEAKEATAVMEAITVMNDSEAGIAKRKQAQRVVLKFMDQVRRRGGENLSDSEIELLTSPEAWLGLE
jgi:hypothetical protein